MPWPTPGPRSAPCSKHSPATSAGSWGGRARPTRWVAARRWRWGALAIAARLPAAVDRASLDGWTAAQLASPVTGVATIVSHAVVDEYLDAGTRTRFRRAVCAAGRHATAAAPVAWIRMEPVSRLRHHGVRMTLWPGGRTRVLARAGAHSTAVTWLPDDNEPAWR